MADHSKQRLDLRISADKPEITRSQAKRLIEEGNVTVNGKTIIKPATEVAVSDVVEWTIPEAKPSKVAPENIPLSIIYEDDDIVVVNKPAGMVVHPGAGVASGTLVNALLFHCQGLSGIGGELRPGIVHRLDKGTTGIIIAAKNDAAHNSLSTQFKNRTTEKYYCALVFGKVAKESGEISAPIGRHRSDRKKMSTRSKKGRSANTFYKVEERFGSELTFLDIKLGTGRTHQIRVHLSHLGYPIVGDDVYGGARPVRSLGEKKMARPMLHARKLCIEHPKSGKRMEFIAPLPDDLKEILNELRNLK